ncbi:hypothetical protein B0T09DRAFT_168220 [Sordaria sp. MPI-SDFR-AT-0083]|nr:hypothetical protein B0T09DRAFT_168220 [Sordaria sp. MPI-SDFR-AT-0083]
MRSSESEILLIPWKSRKTRLVAFSPSGILRSFCGLGSVTPPPPTKLFRASSTLLPYTTTKTSAFVPPPRASRHSDLNILRNFASQHDDHLRSILTIKLHNRDQRTPRYAPSLLVSRCRLISMSLTYVAWQHRDSHFLFHRLNTRLGPSLADARLLACMPRPYPYFCFFWFRLTIHLDSSLHAELVSHSWSESYLLCRFFPSSTESMCTRARRRAPKVFHPKHSR